MKNLMPRWMRELPFSDYLAPLYCILILIAMMGLMGAMMGAPIMLVFTIPFGLLAFLLWRTYHDDGYK